jgi:hypothetical protein
MKEPSLGSLQINVGGAGKGGARESGAPATYDILVENPAIPLRRVYLGIAQGDLPRVVQNLPLDPINRYLVHVCLAGFKPESRRVLVDKPDPAIDIEFDHLARPVEVDAFEDTGDFRIDPTTRVAQLGETVTFASDHPFVIHFNRKTPFNRIVLQSSREEDGRHRAHAAVQFEAAIEVFEFAVALSKETREDKEVRVFVHSSGEIRTCKPGQPCR